MTGHSYKVSDTGIDDILEEWKLFYPRRFALDPSPNLPAAIEVLLGGARVRYPSQVCKYGLWCKVALTCVLLLFFDSLCLFTMAMTMLPRHLAVSSMTTAWMRQFMKLGILLNVSTLLSKCSCTQHVCLYSVITLKFILFRAHWSS